MSKLLSSIDMEQLSAWSSLGSAIFELVALIYAIYTVNNWKIQKDYDLNIELLSKMGGKST